MLRITQLLSRYPLQIWRQLFWYPVPCIGRLWKQREASYLIIRSTTEATNNYWGLATCQVQFRALREQSSTAAWRISLTLRSGMVPNSRLWNPCSHPLYGTAPKQADFYSEKDKLTFVPMGHLYSELSTISAPCPLPSFSLLVPLSWFPQPIFPSHCLPTLWSVFVCLQLFLLEPLASIIWTEICIETFVIFTKEKVSALSF